MTSDTRQAPPRVGEEWRQNNTDRMVTIEDTNFRFAYVWDIHTGRRSRLDLYAFTRRGKAGWTRTKEAPRDL